MGGRLDLSKLVPYGMENEATSCTVCEGRIEIENIQEVDKFLFISQESRNAFLPLGIYFIGETFWLVSCDP